MLIIRFSSFGDIVQNLSILPQIKKRYPDCQIDWLVRSDMAGVLEGQSQIRKSWSFDRSSGLNGLIELGKQLRKENYDIVYDAHANTRSWILKWLLIPFSNSIFIQRPKERLKRILLFKFQINKFPWPFKGMESYLRPLKEVGIDTPIENMSWPKHELSLEVQDYLKDHIILVPSAAWEMKRWPLDHFKTLIREWKERKFLILGGPADTFCEELVEVDPQRVVNLAGKLSLKDSCQVVANGVLTISADTGLIHVADLSGSKGISLVGPTAFGFATNSNIKTLEVDLPCRPCTKDGRGGCSQEIYQKCMVDISPTQVIECAKEILGE